jgi:hypothetical protein
VVSRILSTEQDWIAEINEAFKAVLGSFGILLSTGCSMHVHVEPKSK